MEKVSMFISRTIKLALFALALWIIFLIAMSIAGTFEIMEIFLSAMLVIVTIKLVLSKKKSKDSIKQPGTPPANE